MIYTLLKGLDKNEGAIKIRKDVFVDEQGFRDEFDDTDKTAWHVIIYDKNIPRATGRLYGGVSAMHIGRVAVAHSERGKKYGALVVAILEKKARELCAKKTELSSQIGAVGFYEKLGYKAEGEIYLDENHPHIKMTKNLI